MSTNYSLIFYLKKMKNYVNGPKPNYMRITVAGVRRELSVGHECDPGRWNSRTNRGKGTKEEIRNLNSYLDTLARKVEDVHVQPLYEQLIFDTKSKGYLQVDETPIKVLDSDKKSATHQGYYWVYHALLDRTVLFDYSPTRGGIAAVPMLGNFKGYLQTDGYAVYEKYGKKKEVTHLACWGSR